MVTGKSPPGRLPPLPANKFFPGLGIGWRAIFRGAIFQETIFLAPTVICVVSMMLRKNRGSYASLRYLKIFALASE